MIESPNAASRFGATPVDPEDARAFVSGVAASTLADLDELEGAALARVWQQRVEELLEHRMDIEDLTEPLALVSLHRDSLEGVWTWAGQIRVRETNIGSPPERIRPEMYEALGTVRFWADQTDMTPLEVAARAHHALVRIHPFVDVNGRITRLYADLVMLALSGDQVIDWSESDKNKQAYVAALRTADATTDVTALLAVLASRDLGPT